MKEHVKTLERLGAFCDGLAWAGEQPSMQAAWDDCPRGDDLLWLLEAMAFDHPDLRLAAAYIAQETPTGDGRVVGDLLTDDRSWDAIRCAEQHALGLASDDDMAASRDAASAAAGTASSTWASRAAVWAASITASTTAVSSAVSSAVRAEARAGYSDAVRAWQADAIRMHLPGLRISDAGVITYDSSAGWRAMAAATGEAE